MNKTITKDDIYVELVFPIYIFSVVLARTDLAFAAPGTDNVFGLLLKAVRYGVYIISILFISKHIVKKRAANWVIIIGATSLISLFKNQNVALICSLIVFFALLDCTWETVLKKHFFCLMTCLVVVTTLSQIGIIKDVVRYDTDRVRHFLGFNWTTYAPVICFFLTLNLFCIKKGQIKASSYMVLAGIATALYLLTGTRFAFLMTILFVVLIPAYQYLSRREPYIQSISRLTLLAPFACATLSIAAQAFYDPYNDKLAKIDKLLSGRLYYGNQGIINYGIPIIGGQHIEWYGYDKMTQYAGYYNYVDCSYLHILLEYGFCFLFLFCLLLTLGIYLAYVNKEYYFCWALTFVCIFGMTEIWLLDFSFNPFIWCGVGLLQKPLNKPHLKIGIKRCM